VRRGAFTNAFTLIETLAVITLLAVITAAVAVSLSGARRSADLDGVAEQFVAYDRGTREIARRFGRRTSLRFELNQGTVSRLDDLDSNGTRTTPLAIGGARVARLIVRDESIGYGEASVAFSDGGRSPSYAVLLANNAGQRWVAFAGLTGQAVVLSDERQVREILSGDATAAPAAPWADAR
jgi:prepilin-type N-terminal cleavage/methylation domain-containing protein